MFKPIYLCSLREHVGKSLLSIGIILKLQEEGKKVAYFKPIGVPMGSSTDLISTQKPSWDRGI